MHFVFNITYGKLMEMHTYGTLPISMSTTMLCKHPNAPQSDLLRPLNNRLSVGANTYRFVDEPMYMHRAYINHTFH